MHGFKTLLLAVVTVAAGCGDKYTTYGVHGRVTLKDGTPLDAVRLTFELAEHQPPISATASTDENGAYELGILETGDGAPAGNYRVVVSEPGRFPEDPRPRRIHSKYWSFETSGLEFTVKPEDNTFDIQLDPLDGQ